MKGIVSLAGRPRGDPCPSNLSASIHASAAAAAGGRGGGGRRWCQAATPRVIFPSHPLPLLTAKKISISFLWPDPGVGRQNPRKKSSDPWVLRPMGTVAAVSWRRAFSKMKLQLRPCGLLAANVHELRGRCRYAAAAATAIDSRSPSASTDGNVISLGARAPSVSLDRRHGLDDRREGACAAGPARCDTTRSAVAASPNDDGGAACQVSSIGVATSPPFYGPAVAGSVKVTDLGQEVILQSTVRGWLWPLSSPYPAWCSVLAVWCSCLQALSLGWGW